MMVQNSVVNDGPKPRSLKLMQNREEKKNQNEWSTENEEKHFFFNRRFLFFS